MGIQKSPVKMEPTMELRWAVEPGTSTKDMELQQAFWMVGESSKQKVWCAVPIHVKMDS